ncbi:PAS domain S-box protein, partial [bacterium]|nr:PAS domain S-box protein [bacterium]
LKEAYDIISRSPAVAFLWKNDEEWPVEFVTDNVEAIFGYTAEEFISGKVTYTKTVHPDDLERVAQEVSTYSDEEGRKTFTHEPYRIVAKDGKVKWIEDRTYITKDKKGKITHYQGIVEDISERKLAEDELKYQKKHLESLIRYSSLAIVTLEDNHNVISCNRYFEDLFQFKESEILNKNLDELISGQKYLEDARAYTRKTREGEAIQGSGKRYRKDGTSIDVEFFGVPVIVDGKVVGAYGIYRDIGERKRAEEALRKAHEELEQRVEERPVELSAQMEETEKLNRAMNNVLDDLEAANKDLQQEIAERWWAEKALLASELKFRTLHESSRDAVMVLDEEKFIDCNSATLEIFGCASREEFCGKHPSELSP